MYQEKLQEGKIRNCDKFAIGKSGRKGCIVVYSGEAAQKCLFGLW